MKGGSDMSYYKNQIDLDHPEWTLDYFLALNEKLEEVGLPKLIIDVYENEAIVYKDELHKYLGIGILLEKVEES